MAANKRITLVHRGCGQIVAIADEGVLVTDKVDHKKLTLPSGRRPTAYEKIVCPVHGHLTWGDFVLG